MGIITEFLEQRKIGLQCKALSGPELKRGWFCQNFQGASLGYCIKMSYIPILTSPNFYGIFEEIFKQVVVKTQNRAELKRRSFPQKLQHQDGFLHKIDL